MDWRPRAGPTPVISNTPISSVGPKRFLIARRMRNWCEPSPSNDSTASTICSTTRGPAIWPSLVTWPTRMTAAPVRLAKRISSAAEPRTWVTVPGAASTLCVHMVWIEFDDQEPRRRALRQRRDDVFDRRFRRRSRRRHRQGQAARRAAAPGRPLPRRKCRRRGAGRGRRPPRPRAAASICRCRDRRRAAAPSRAPGRRRSPGRIRRCQRQARGASCGCAFERLDGEQPALAAIASALPRLPRPACSIRRRRRSGPTSARKPRRNSGRCSSGCAPPCDESYDVESSPR